MAIKAPYNFVPLADKVYIPDWSNKISQDIPFKDGLSGVLEVSITAQTPVFVRNGHTQREEEEARKLCKDLLQNAGNDQEKYLQLLQAEITHNPKAYFLFSSIGERPFIPATTLKGAIRNVMEIMSFSRINVDKNSMFAQRDWNNEALYTLKRNQSAIRCGWLKIVNGKYQILNCGRPRRISMAEIDRYTKSTVMHDHFSNEGRVNLNVETTFKNRKYDPKTAEYKYALLDGVKLENLSFIEDEDKSSEEFGRIVLKVHEYGPIKGSIVLTGQSSVCKWNRPGRQDPRAGKFYEFVFEETEDTDIIAISDEEFEHFKFIYSDTWDFLKKRLYSEKGLPVFFRLEGDGIKDLGMTYLYKLPYDNSPFDLVEKNYKSQPVESHDLAECIFGYTADTESLKGRVQFSNLFATGDYSYDKMTAMVLSSPKASYYPTYIRQDGGQYKTYNDGMLSGWKRYPVRREAHAVALNNADQDTVIYPLQEGTVFKGKVCFHNLKEAELGALLSALTFHNHSSECYHQIGQGKPYGFGKISVECRFVDESLEQRRKEFMAKFEKEMCDFLRSSWVDSLQIRELFTMAHQEVTPQEILFDYMHMDTNRDANDFLNAKSLHEYLELYTKLKKETYSPESIYAEYQKVYREQQKIEEENRRQEEIKLLQDTVNGLIEEIRIYISNNENIDLQQLQDYKQRILSFFDKNLSPELSDDCQKCSASIDEAQRHFLDKQNSERALGDVLTGISNVGTALGNTKKWLNGRSLPEAEKQCLLEKLSAIYLSLKKADRKKCKWKILSELIGEEEAKSWLNQLTKD